MGSPLSPVVTDLFMENSEYHALSKAQPKWCFRFVNDTLVIWPHGLNKSDDFLRFLNGLHLYTILHGNRDTKYVTLS